MKQMRRDPVTRKWVIVDVASDPIKTVERIHQSVQQEYDSKKGRD